MFYAKTPNEKLFEPMVQHGFMLIPSIMAFQVKVGVLQQAIGVEGRTLTETAFVKSWSIL